MNIEALSRLADKLEGTGPYAKDGPVPDEQFDLTVWQCGTAACACGWAAQDIWFNERGFTMCLTYGESSTVHFMSRDADAYEFDAVCAMFDIGWLHAHQLFNHSAYAPDGCTTSHVARRIRAFIGGE